MSSSSWIERKAFDCFGRELEAHECEYCGQLKPVKLWNGIDGSGETYKILMAEFIGRDGHKAWICKECSADIASLD